MPSHPDRVRKNCPEMNCNHFWIYKMQSDIAPFIESNGDRTTIKFCFNCGLEERYTRTQQQFEAELEIFPAYYYKVYY